MFVKQTIHIILHIQRMASLIDFNCACLKVSCCD